jgi:hypothetical protein
VLIVEKAALDCQEGGAKVECATLKGVWPILGEPAGSLSILEIIDASAVLAENLVEAAKVAFDTNQSLLQTTSAAMIEQNSDQNCNSRNEYRQ